MDAASPDAENRVDTGWKNKLYFIDFCHRLHEDFTFMEACTLQALKIITLHYVVKLFT